MVEAGMIGLNIDRIEFDNEFKYKQRERALTQLYAKMNNRFKYRIYNADGALRSQNRKIKKFMDSKQKDAMLFDGLRDQKLKCKWNKTP